MADEEMEGIDPVGPLIFKEFDCPECNANNPWDDGFRDGDEIRCHYCGEEFAVHVGDDNRPKFKLI